jgi:hypothetical protein
MPGQPSPPGPPAAAGTCLAMNSSLGAQQPESPCTQPSRPRHPDDPFFPHEAPSVADMAWDSRSQPAPLRKNRHYVPPGAAGNPLNGNPDEVDEDFDYGGDASLSVELGGMDPTLFDVLPLARATLSPAISPTMEPSTQQRRQRRQRQQRQQQRKANAPVHAALSEETSRAMKHLGDVREDNTKVGRKAIITKVVDFEATFGHHVLRQTKPRSSHNLIRVVCADPACGFVVNLRQGKRSCHKWSVDFSTSSLQHRQQHPRCNSTLSRLGAGVGNKQSLLQQIKALGPTTNHVGTKALNDVLLRHNIFVPANKDAAYAQQRKRLKVAAFQSDSNGIAAQLSLMTNWVSLFNSYSANGVASLHIMKEPGSNVPVFRALTVVFQPSVALFLYCSYRVLSVDAAFEYKGRDDKNYIILEGITSDQHIFPLAFGFCFGESKDSYDQFWQDVLGYSGPLKDAIDNPATRINADRNGGLRASVHENLVHGDQILHNDPVHLKRNVRQALRKQGCPFQGSDGHMADQLLDELMKCNVMADVPGHWKAIESFNKVMHDYLRTCQPQWWIEAYFTTTMDGFKTTSNYAEQENARFKRLGLRAMPPLDFVDGVCQVASDVATDARNVAKSRLQKGQLLTEYAQGLLDESHVKAHQLVVEGDDTAGTFVVAPRTDASGLYGCRQHIVELCNGKYSVEELPDFSARMGLPSPPLVAVNTYINSNNQRQAPELFVHPMHHNSTAVQHLSNHSMVRRPDRSTLVVAPLVYPPCKTTVVVKIPRSSNGKRYHAHGEQSTASSQLPCQQQKTHPDIIAAQQRLASMNCNGPDLLIVLHRQRNRSRSTFPQASITADAVTAHHMWRPYRYMPAANNPAVRDAHGTAYVHETAGTRVASASLFL